MSVCLCLCVSMCLYGGYTDVHCGLNNMLDSAFGWAPGLYLVCCLTNARKENLVILSIPKGPGC